MIIKLSFPEYGCITGCDLHNSLIININRGAGGCQNKYWGMGTLEKNRLIVEGACLAKAE